MVVGRILSTRFLQSVRLTLALYPSLLRSEAEVCRNFSCNMANPEAVFKQHQVVADVIPHAPAHLLKVSYGGHAIEPGQVMTPTQVKDQPHVEWDAEHGAFYTLIMTDPDAPSRQDPKFREWHHWMVNNIPGNDVNHGEHNSQYVGSGPPKGTGLHRYVFLLYKQPGKVDTSKLPKLSNRSSDGRGKRKASDIIKELHITDLVAGNFYQAEWDDYVPKLYEQLSGK